jgi:hypothetical protein
MDFAEVNMVYLKKETIHFLDLRSASLVNENSTTNANDLVETNNLLSPGEIDANNLNDIRNNTKKSNLTSRLNHTVNIFLY